MIGGRFFVQAALAFCASGLLSWAFWPDPEADAIVRDEGDARGLALEPGDPALDAGPSVGPSIAAGSDRPRDDGVSRPDRPRLLGRKAELERRIERELEQQELLSDKLARLDEDGRETASRTPREFIEEWGFLADLQLGAIQVNSPGEPPDEVLAWARGFLESYPGRSDLRELRVLVERGDVEGIKRSMVDHFLGAVEDFTRSGLQRVSELRRAPGEFLPELAKDLRARSDREMLVWECLGEIGRNEELSSDLRQEIDRLVLETLEDPAADDASISAMASQLRILASASPRIVLAVREFARSTLELPGEDRDATQRRWLAIDMLEAAPSVDGTALLVRALASDPCADNRIRAAEAIARVAPDALGAAIEARLAQETEPGVESRLREILDEASTRAGGGRQR